MKQKFEKMLEMQDAMNAKVNPDWRSAGYNWNRAVFVECGELMDHIGWKWWKKQEPNIEQAKIELVDIWHFGMSDMIVNVDMPFGEMALIFEKSFNRAVEFSNGYEKNKETMLVLTESLAEYSIRYEVFNDSMFYLAMYAFDMSFDELYQMYIGKNVLNFFRQDNGYKDGSYVKDWNGEEDNVVLSRIMSEINMDTKDVDSILYSMLKSYYNREVLKAA